MCCGVNISETETTPAEPTSKSARRRMEIHQFNFVPTDSAVAPPLESGGKKKRQKIEAVVPVPPALRECMNGVRSFEVEEKRKEMNQLPSEGKGPETKAFGLTAAAPRSGTEHGAVQDCPKFGMTSVCGRRRDMEDAVSIHPSFCGQNRNFPGGLHFFGVFDGHGCSHVSNEVDIRTQFNFNEVSELEFDFNFDSSDCRWPPGARTGCTK